MHQLLITVVIKVRYNRNSVVNLVSKRIHAVVHNHHAGQVSVLDYPQVFYVVTFWRQYTVLSVKAMLEQCVVRVNIVQYCICVYLV